MALLAATTLAACGSETESGGTSASGGGDAVVQTNDSGVLVDGSGMTLYTADVEEGGKIACVDSCIGFWFPLTVSSETVTAPEGLPGDLATITRPDTGDLQVTYDGMPLYTYKLDGAAGDTEGDGFSDDFAGQLFTWSAVTVDGAAVTTEDNAPPEDDGGYDY